MTTVRLACEYCGTPVVKVLAQWLRSGPHAYCDRTCSGLARRQHKSVEDKQAAKAIYDRTYRATNLAEIRRKKAEHFRKTYDPVKAAVERKKNMPRHVAYCRRPAYRQWKHAYDIKYNAKRNYGDFGEAFVLLQEIQSEVDKRMTDYEIRLQQGTLNKRQTRARSLQQSTI